MNKIITKFQASDQFVNAASLLSWLIGLLWIYIPVIRASTILERDDFSLVSPLRNIHSIKDYLTSRAAFKVMDVQPIRDLSLWINIQLDGLLGFQTYHIVNVIIWSASAFVLFKILKFYKTSSLIQYLVISLFLFHPMAVNNVGWISARKHLLSVFFIEVAIYLVLKITEDKTLRKYWILVPLLYGLSVFSHPITLFWPVWFFFMIPKERRVEYLPSFIVTGILTLLCAYLNYTYYTGYYVFDGAIPKFGSFDLGISLLAFSRYFMQIIFPVQTPVTTYYPGSLLNMGGVIMFPLFIYYIFKVLNKKEIFIWIGIYVLTIGFMSFNMTNIFGSDTYAILSLFAIAVLLARILSTAEYKKNISRFVITCCVIVIPLFLIKSERQANAWTSDELFSENAYKQEASPDSATLYGLSLLKNKNYDESLELAFRVREWRSNQKNLDILLGKSIVDNPNIPVDKKLKLLLDNPVEGEMYYYNLSVVYAMKENFPEAETQIKKVLTAPRALGEDLPIATAEYTYFCLKNKKTNCNDLSEVVRTGNPKYWSEEKWIQRKKELGI